MSEIHNQREIELLESQLRECRAENAKLREALEWAAVQLGNNNLPAFAHQVRAVLGGEND